MWGRPWREKRAHERSARGRQDREERASRDRALAQLRFLLEYGDLAPASGVHGAPPWLLRLQDGAIDVVFAHRCGRDAFDAGHREVLVACGAAIAQLRLALRQIGFRESLVTFPDPAQRLLLARVYLDDTEPPTPEAYVLYQALRGPIIVDDGTRAVDDALLAEIKAVCEQERVRLHYVDRSILAVSDRVRAVDDAAMCDVPSIGEALTLLHPFHLETFRPDLDTWTNGQDPSLGHSAVAALITTADDGPPDWLAAGQALSRALLRARVDGVSAVVQGLASPTIRTELVRGLRGEHPQIVARFGYLRVAA